MPRKVWGGASWSLGSHAWDIVGMGPGEASSLLQDGEHRVSSSSSSWDSGNETSFLKIVKPTEKLKEEFREHLCALDLPTVNILS